jgi:hypothetical protein
MNLLNKNKLGIFLYKKNFGPFKCLKNELLEKNRKRPINGEDSTLFENNSALIHREMLDFNCQKTVRISDSVFYLAQSINIESIINNIDTLDLKFTDIYILMPSDKIGCVILKKIGEDVFFVWMQNLNPDSNLMEYEVNIYNFFTKEFAFGKSEKSFIILQILTYLFYGEVQEKICKPNVKIGSSFEYIKNESTKDIWFADSLWKTNLSIIGDFKVSGHFRLQPFGEGRANKKLIFIEEFVKHGYNRTATLNRTGMICGNKTANT